MMKLEEQNLVWMRSVGRVFLGALFIYSGVMTLMGGMAGIAGFAGAIGGTGFPAAAVVVWVVLAIKVIGGSMLILGWHSRMAAAALAAFTLLTIVFVHNNAAESIAALKNLGIIGGLMYVIATGPGPYTIVSFLHGNAGSEAQKQNEAARAAL